MLVIRLSRVGRKNTPIFHVVVTEKSAPAKGGKPLERLGLYEIAKQPAVLTIDKERVKYWISVGARPSDRMARLLAKEGMSGMEPFAEFGKKFAKRNKNTAVPEAVPATSSTVVPEATEPKA